MSTRWVSFDLKTGRRGPVVKTSQLGTVKRIIGEATDATLSVYCWDAANNREVPGWNAASLPGAAVLAAVDDDEAILWAGLSVRRESGVAATSVSTTVATLEHYLARRYVGDHPLTLLDLGPLFASFAQDAVTDGPPFVIDAVTIGTVLGRDTLATDDLRVGDVLDEFRALGVEYTVEPEWANEERTMIQFRIRARARLGVASSTPAVTYSMPGNMIDGRYLEDYSEDHGANDVMATSSGEGSARPESTHHTAVLPSWCRFEKRITPAESLTETGTLDTHAADELAQTWDGLKQLTVTARLDAATVPGLGDDIAVSITSPRFPARVGSDGSLTDGYSAIVRAIGWEIDLDAQAVEPILVERQEIP